MMIVVVAAIAVALGVALGELCYWVWYYCLEGGK